MRTKKLLSVVSAALGLAFASGPASAALIWYTPFTSFEDSNIDFVFDNDGDGFISQGDRLLSVAVFPNQQGVLPGQSNQNFAPPEITAVSDITVTSAIPTGTGETIFTFGASGGAGVLSGFAAGTTVAVFTDNTPDLDVTNGTCGTQAQCLLTAGLGAVDPASSLFLTLGFEGDADETWVSESVAGGASIATVTSGNASATFARFNFAQSIIVNNTGQTFGLQSCAPFCGLFGDGMIEVVGSGDIKGGQGLVLTNWTARSNAAVQLAPIPEPGSLALVGLGLAGLGWARRKMGQK